MKAAAIRAISLIVLLVIPNITSSHQLKDSPFQGDEGHWGVVRSGYLSAGKYLALKPDTQGAYMAGMIDGMYLAPMFDAPDEDKYLVRIRVCVTDGDLTNTQIAAIVTKYAKKRPDEWRAGANVVAYQALREFRPAI
ncbi:MAG: Rap1a/Tai family immunity protein [Candidatus Acidiferrales bacterium]